MKMEQIYELVNAITEEITGQTDLVQEDLSNVVDVGTEIFRTSDVDHYVRSLINHIGRVIFVNRPYSGSAPSVLMDSWEFGSVLEKIQAELPEAIENETWELEDGQSYDMDVFYKPVVTAKFFNQRVTFEIPQSITERQCKESFSSAEQLNGFLSMLYNAVDKSMTVKIDELIMRTINNFVGETVYNAYGDEALSSKSTIRAINLLYLYNNKFNKSLPPEDTLTDPEFSRYAAYEMAVFKKRLSKISTRFNMGGKARFTSEDMLKCVMLSDFQIASAIYLQSDVFHDKLIPIPTADSVPYWQGSGDEYSFEDITTINIKTASGHDMRISGVLAVMFDRDALGVSNLNRRVTTHYNAKGEFFNNYHKFEAGYFNDFNENLIVFFVA